MRSAPPPFRGGALDHAETDQLLEDQLGAHEPTPEDIAP